MFAGSLQRVTQTLPLAIYAEFDRNFDATLAMSGVLVLISVALLLGLRIGLTWEPLLYVSTNRNGLSRWRKTPAMGNSPPRDAGANFNRRIFSFHLRNLMISVSGPHTVSTGCLT